MYFKSNCCCLYSIPVISFKSWNILSVCGWYWWLCFVVLCFDLLLFCYYRLCLIYWWLASVDCVWFLCWLSCVWNQTTNEYTPNFNFGLYCVFSGDSWLCFVIMCSSNTHTLVGCSLLISFFPYFVFVYSLLLLLSTYFLFILYQM